MTEGIQVDEDAAAAARAAEQTRIRKERREAKIKGSASTRLSKITSLGGGIQRAPEPQPSSETSTPEAAATLTTASEQHGDPEEVDISQHYYEPGTTARPELGDLPSNVSEAQLRQMMLGLNHPSSAGATPPMPGMEGMEEDPMMKMLSQMMGGMPGGPGAGGADGANPFAGTPMDGLFGNLSKMNGGANPMQQAQQEAANKTANLWRILHAVFALGLGLFLAFTTTFTGTQSEREHATIANKYSDREDSIEHTRAYFFYVFSTVEALLLTTRYFLEKDREPPKGWMWTVSGFLPGPIKGYTQHALRYGRILGTVRNDALVCVFVLGVCSWWRA